MTLSLLGAGVVLALFVLVPRAAAAIRRHPVLLAGAVLAAIPVTFIFGVGYFGDGRYFYGLPDLLAELAPVALIALAALGGVVLLADDLRTGRPRARTPWQRLTGATEAPARRAVAGAGRDRADRPRRRARARARAPTRAAASPAWSSCSRWPRARSR